MSNLVRERNDFLREACSGGLKLEDAGLGVPDQDFPGLLRERESRWEGENAGLRQHEPVEEDCEVSSGCNGPVQASATAAFCQTRCDCNKQITTRMQPAGESPPCGKDFVERTVISKLVDGVDGSSPKQPVLGPSERDGS